MKNVPWKLVPGPFFNFQRIPCKEDSEEVSMLTWTNFELCYYISNTNSSLLQQFHFPVDVVLNSSQIVEVLSAKIQLFSALCGTRKIFCRVALRYVYFQNI